MIRRIIEWMIFDEIIHLVWRWGLVVAVIWFSWSRLHGH